MIQIRPVSDLRTKFTDIEKAVGGGETALDEADKYAEENQDRYTHEEVFTRLRRRING